jgi:hypothetical protein
MSKKIFTIALLLSIVVVGYAAKSTGVVYGKVVDKSTGESLPHATIVILNAADSIVAGATANQDGSFRIEKVLVGEHTIKSLYIGYKEYVSKITLTENSNSGNIGTIEMESDAVAMNAVVITAKVPVIEQRMDMLIMNVADAVSTEGNTALEVLKKAPGVSIDHENNIKLNGSSVAVWIDGRPSNLSGTQLEALLSGTEGSSIDKIEIISHPSSKYDASGSGGIINIKTKKNFAQGFNGSVRTSFSIYPYEKLYPEASGSVNLNYRGDKSNTSVTYSPGATNFYQEIHSETGLPNNVTLFGDSKLEQAETRHTLRVTHDYHIDQKNIVGIVLTGMTRKEDIGLEDGAGSRMYQNSTLIETSATSSNSDESFDNLYGNLNYTRIFKDNQEITLNADYSRYNIGAYLNQGDIFAYPTGISPMREDQIFRSDSKQKIDIASVKADYQQLIGSSIMFEAGAKWAQSSTDNNLLREDFKNSVWDKNISLSSVFKYKESVSAAYVSFAKQFGPKWSLKGGLRTEYTLSQGDWISAATTTENDYIDLFPTLFVGFNPNKELRFGLSYTSRINRPRFDQLNPFKFYADAYSSIEGNPDLLPEYSDQLNLSVGFKQYFNFALSGQFTNKMIAQNIQVENNGEKVIFWDNFGKQNFLGASISITELPITKWFYVSMNAFLANSYNESGSYKNSSSFAQGYINSSILLPHNIKVELSANYQSKVAYAYYIIDPSYQISAALRKGMFDNKATISLNINDIFRTATNNLRTNRGVGNTYRFDSTFNTQKITLSFSYRFGQSRAVKQRNVGAEEGSERVK